MLRKKKGLGNLSGNLMASFHVVPRAAADDKDCPPGTVSTSNSAALAERGRVSTSFFKNLLASIGLPFADSICGRKTVDIIYTRTTPVADADYAYLPIGSLCVYVPITSTAVTDAKIFIKRSTGWEAILTSGSGGVGSASVITHIGTAGTAGGGTLETIVVTGALPSDKARVRICSYGALNVTLTTYSLITNTLIVTTSKDASTDHALAYEIYRSGVSS